MASRGKKKNPDKVRNQPVQKHALKNRALRQAEDNYQKTFKIYTAAIIAFVVLALVFMSLPLFRVELVFSESIAGLLGNADAHTTFNIPKLIGAAFYSGSMIEYFKNDIPILQKAENFVNLEDYVTQDLQAQIAAVYVAVFVVSLIIVLLLLAIAVLIGLKLSKCKNLPMLAISSLVYVFTLISVVLFFLFIAVTVETTNEMIFGIGAGMWLTLVISVAASVFCVIESVSRHKLKKISTEEKNG